ncbi:MAG TPA: glycosyltransferase family 1 protein [Candidatus Baltobacteraceae bacterium]|nr:glycosyltransferase family 1 protein [Candidatus Baltobacteraceae bacterium]
MKVGLDAQLTLGTATGIGEYVAGLLAALPAAGIDARALAAPALDPWRFDRRLIWDQLLLPLAARRARVDLLHCAAGTMPLARTLPVVTTVHDVAWLRVQTHARAYARWYFGRFALARYRGARRIVVDSAFSRDELLTFAALDPAHVEVVHPGVAEDVRALVRRPAHEPFFLAVGTVEPRKNLEVVIRALAAVPGARLIAAGPATPYQQTCARLAQECGVAARVTFAGYVARRELLDLYARAAAAVVPSRYEGFGYGAAQALCAGVPLVASGGSSLDEVVAGAAPQVAADDVAGWRDALCALLAGRDEAERHAAAQRPRALVRFAWEAAAAAMAGVYRRALAPA